MSVSDRRRAPFCWLSVAALELIDENVPEGTLAGVRNTYLALAQVAARARDGHHDGFEATVREIASAAHVDRATIKRHLPILCELGLLDVERREAANGATLSSCYVLLEPGQYNARPDTGASGNGGAHDAPPPAHDAPLGAHGTARHAPPTRARQTAVKKEEELTTPQPPPQASGEQAHQPALGITCPRCSQPPGSPCRTNRGQVRPGAHQARMTGAAHTAATLGDHPDAATPDLEQRWQRTRDEIRRAVTPIAWRQWLDALDLEGTRGTELVLTGPPAAVAYARDRYPRILKQAARKHISPDATVTLHTATTLLRVVGGLER